MQIRIQNTTERWKSSGPQMDVRPIQAISLPKLKSINAIT